MAKGRTLEKDYEQALDRMIDELFEFAVAVHGMTWAELAAEAKLSLSTISNLGNRETRFPEYRTIYRIAKAVGCEVKVEEFRKQQRRQQRRRAA